MKIALASDHAGFELKQFIKGLLANLKHEMEDFGTHSTESVDFVDHVYPAALAVAEGRAQRAILIDGAGYPSGIVGNLIPGVFAAVCNDPVSARFAREHSDTNVLCMGGKVIGALLAQQIVETWLSAEFLGGKYARRVNKVKELAERHKRPLSEKARTVITVQDIKDCLARKQSLLIDSKTIITPSVKDLLP
ncbi:MAG: RpiB/LacA/LacB family sugar-phosphate isomerase [Candidatus Sumerlaeaceae bacterium]|nr:RpiB/LacA/LacB family sugar-phosphate isomerase [Candidatus Sumerlaeaceae bacterium]